jgi:hypothetical protein
MSIPSKLSTPCSQPDISSPTMPAFSAGSSPVAAVVMLTYTAPPLSQ